MEDDISEALEGLDLVGAKVQHDRAARDRPLHESGKKASGRS
jgi:hypothetical protein